MTYLLAWYAQDFLWVSRRREGSRPGDFFAYSRLSLVLSLRGRSTGDLGRVPGGNSLGFTLDRFSGYQLLDIRHDIDVRTMDMAFPPDFREDDHTLRFPPLVREHAHSGSEGFSCGGRGGIEVWQAYLLSAESRCSVGASCLRRLCVEVEKPGCPDHRPEMNLRLALWKLFLLFSLLLLAGGLYFFQIVNADAYVRLAANNRLRFIRFAPIRGEIFDRNGVPLAANVTTFDIMGYPA